MIYIQKIKNHLEHKQEILDLIEQDEGHPQTRDDQKLTKSDWVTTKDKQDALMRDGLKPFMDCFIKHNWQQLHRFVHDQIVHDVNGIQFTNYWYQQYYKSDFHGWHNHRKAMLACVYYLELPEGTPTTEFWMPHERSITTIDAEEGDLVVFPAFLRHRSPPNESDERKTIIAWNCS